MHRRAAPHNFSTLQILVDFGFQESVFDLEPFIGSLQFLEKSLIFNLQFISFQRTPDNQLEFLTFPGLGHILVDMSLVDGLDQRSGIGIAGQDNTNDLWVDLDDLFEQLYAGHFRHSLIRNNQCDVLLLQNFQGFSTAGCSEYLIIFCKSERQAPQNFFLIINDEQTMAFHTLLLLNIRVIQ